MNNGGRCVVIDVHGFANLHRHPNTANPTCPCLAAISNMAVHCFFRLVVHGNPSPWRKRFFLLAQQCFGATYEPALELPWWKRGNSVIIPFSLFLLDIKNLSRNLNKCNHQWMEKSHDALWRWCVWCSDEPCQINKVLSHPTLPITITAQEDRHIRFYDNNTGDAQKSTSNQIKQLLLYYCCVVIIMLIIISILIDM